jgi:hypothetical protein
VPRDVNDSSLGSVSFDVSRFRWNELLFFGLNRFDGFIWYCIERIRSDYEQ